MIFNYYFVIIVCFQSDEETSYKPSEVEVNQTAFKGKNIRGHCTQLKRQI